MMLGNISFPFNVYAAILEWSDVPLDHLHFGLFDHADEPIAQAQQRASELLWTHLPPPCRVLEVGVGLGTMQRRLVACGYRAHGITPDAEQAAIARSRHGETMAVTVTRLEDLQVATEPWDLMLLQGSAQVVQPLALFEAADRLLTADGATLLLLDEFALERRAAGHAGLHHYPAFLALAARFGWQVEVEQDMSGSAGHSLRALEAMLLRHRERLRCELGVLDDQFSTLVESIHRHLRLYQAGVYGYRLLRLHRPSRPSTAIGRVGQAQSIAMRELFGRVFGHPMDDSEWNWKYGQGRGRAVGLWQDSRLVVHFGALTRRVQLMGQPALACQVADVMVSPEANAGLGRQGAFYKVGATLLEAEIGWAQPHAVGFGFPNSRHMRVAQRVRLYAAVDTVDALSWPTVLSASDQPTGGDAESVDLSELSENSPLWHELALMWRKMAESMPDAVFGARDPAWLRHRYGRRPHVRYDATLLRSRADGSCLGMVVLRVHGHAVELIDLVGDAANFRSLVRLARYQSHVFGRSQLETWVTRSHRALLDDPADPAREQQLDVTVPANAHTPGIDAKQLRGRWFLMAGDTDFR